LTIRAIVFDIGGVLEITPRTGWEKGWETRLGLQQGGLVERLGPVWRDGDVGNVSEEEMEKRTGEILGLDREQLDAFLRDLWDEYCGTLNTELADYFASLRPHYITGIISNSFVGARRIEHERYGFGDMCDLIVYSHEVGVKKPDRRIFEIACERFGVQPSEIIFLDDVEAAVTAARKLGIHAFLFNDNAQAIADIEACLETEGQSR
jgi:putative hydrolase of the HAD superfamily